MNGDEEHPRRRAEDFDPGVITEAELPRYCYRELGYLRRRLASILESVNALEHAVFGYQEGVEWVKGLAQNLADMRTQGIENGRLMRRVWWTIVAVLAVVTLDGAHPGWGDALLRVLGLHF